MNIEEFIDENGIKYTKESLLKGIRNHINFNYIGGGGPDNFLGNWNGTIAGLPDELAQYAVRRAVPIPEEYINLFKQYSGGWLDWRLLAALCCIESNMNPRASNSVGHGHYGLGQQDPVYCHYSPNNKEWLFTPENAIKEAAWQLNNLYTNYACKQTSDTNTAIILTLSAYNSGAGSSSGVFSRYKSSKNLIEAFRGASNENKKYAPSILKVYSEYREKYN